MIIGTVKFWNLGYFLWSGKSLGEDNRFQQDNDPKHTSGFTKDFFAKKINWWKTPPESLDLNPIENVWGSMKQFLRKEYKPQNLDELKTGIWTFWRRMTPEVCSDYIAHIQK